MKSRFKPTEEQVRQNLSLLEDTAIVKMCIKNPNIANLIGRLDLEVQTTVTDCATKEEIFDALPLKTIRQINNINNKKSNKMAKSNENQNNKNQNNQDENGVYSKYPKGILVFEPHKNAPNFVLADVIINPDSLFEWFENNRENMIEYKGIPQMKFQLLSGENGMYLKVNNFVPEKQEEKEEPKKNSRFKK